MRSSGTTSWRRVSDPLPNDALRAGTPSPRAPALGLKEAQQLEAWEGEGGPSAPATETVRILIVDIDMKSSNTLELLLQASGYPQTRVAYSGHAALAIAQDFQPSVVLVELNLLDMSGYELALLLRRNARNRDLRLIAMTSSREHAGRELARVGGFERYLYKPVVDVDILSILQPG